MIRSLLLAGVFGAATFQMAQAGSVLDYAEIEDSIVDRPMAYARGSDRGQIVYDSSNQVVITKANGDIEYGQWELDGDKMCVRMESPQARSGCFTVRRTSDEGDDVAEYRTSNGGSFTEQE